MAWQCSEIWLCLLDYSGIDGRTLIVLLTIKKKKGSSTSKVFLLLSLFLLILNCNLASKVLIRYFLDPLTLTLEEIPLMLMTLFFLRPFYNFKL